MVFTTALIAVPRTGAIFIIEAIAILTTAEGAWLMFICELIWCKTAKMRQQVGPPAVG
jgi:hypothetical protein